MITAEWLLTGVCVSSCIFISHDLSVVRYIADRIAVMEQGKIVEVQEAEQLFETPESEITKTLLSAIPQMR